MKKLLKKHAVELWSIWTLKSLSAVFTILFFSSCSEQNFDPGSDLQNQAIIDQVNLYVNQGECAKAIDLIEPLYNSEHTNNTVRKTRASAHLCNAGLTSYFSFLNKIVTNPLCVGNDCTEIWITPSREFTLSGGVSDANTISFTKRKESALLAIDALQSILEDGVVLPDSAKINSGSWNVGSLRVSDRTDDANLFIFIASMTSLGAIHNLNVQSAALPFTDNYLRRLDFTWTDFSAMPAEGCEYASSAFNLIDAADQLGSTFDSGIDAPILSNLNTACSAYCQAICGFTATQCGTSCSLNLRNRDACMSDEIAQCHAAAFVDFIHTDANYGYPCEAGGC